MDNNISFSKIVATPTLNSWSQAYNAGKLFAVLSLEKTRDLPPETESLNMLGKDLLEHLEHEFYAIEDKNLETIKKAVSVVFQNPIEGLRISFAAGFFLNNILYLFGLGNAKVFIKRTLDLGVALDSGDSTPEGIASSSGFLEEKDLIVLATEGFSQVIANEDLSINLNDAEPDQITESLAPKIHRAQNGKISAIVIKYAKPVVDSSFVQDEIAITPQTEEIVEEVVDEIVNTNKVEVSTPVYPFSKYLSFFKSKFSRRRNTGVVSEKPNIKIKLTKKIFLTLTVIIIVVLIFSVSLTIQEQKNAKATALFAQIYPQAQKKYDEGQSLVDLNKNLARDSFQAAEKILQDNESQFPAKSKEAIQTQDLLAKIENGLSSVSPVDKSGLDRSKLSITVENGSGVEGTAGKAAKILKDLGYNVVSTGNADNFNYEGVTIQVKDPQSNFVNLLKKDLANDYTVTSGTSDLAPDSSTDAVIIIGK
jgi:cell division protein FtsL